ncbi:MAG: hypothetical protein K2K36_06545 [Muribaculaceae bacterium]|nr:hypothetical protein [Muribaculaceae bacterium]
MRKSLLIPALAAAFLTAPSAAAINIGDKVAVHGSVQADGLFPQEDAAIGTGSYDRTILFNTYADVNVLSEYVDGGIRAEFMKWPLPGYEPDFAGWGIPHIYLKGKFKGFELTAGDFYEQFGSGFILRTYEERSLGIDNSIRGARLKVNAINGLRLTALGGVQRRYWDWKKSSQVYGADAEASLEEWFRPLRDKGAIWTAGLSYVLKHEDDQVIMVPGTDSRLRFPKSVSAVDARTHFQKGAWGVQGEFAWKGQDPSFDNSYTYRPGTALMLSGSYTRKGLSALVQAKRSENMAFRSQRSMTGTSAFLNNMPAFAYQHTYALAAIYPYATQAAPGEWAFQGAFAYTFKRKTPLGGRYGTKLKVNLSYISGLDKTPGAPGLNGYEMGTDGPTSSFFGMGRQYYRDANVQIEKRLTRSLQLTFMYMNQFYNQTVIEGHGGEVNTNIFVLDGKYKFDNRFTLRGELQYLATRQDKKDWAYGLLELSVQPYLMISVSDMWNCGGDGTHYYMAGITGNYRANRLMLSYGRTRAGFNCSGGVCRYVPASRGFQIGYTYNF